MLAMTSNPYGDNELFKGLKQSPTPSDAFKATNPLAQKALLESSNNYKISPSASVSRLKVKAVSAVVSKKSLFDGLEEYDASLEDSFTVKMSAKRLIIKPRTPIDASKTITETSSRSIRDESKVVEKENLPELFQNQIPTSPYVDNNPDQDSDRRVSWLRTAPQQNIRARQNIRDPAVDTTISQLVTVNKDAETYKDKLETSAMNASMLNETFNSNADDTQNEADISIYAGPVEPHFTGIVLRRVGYYTIPSLDEMKEFMDDQGRCIVPNFTVGRRGYGNVYFDEEIDVAGLNLDEICHFRNKEIILYQDDDNKPPVGEGLNRRAQVTLDQIWPIDKTTHEPIKDPIRLETMSYEAKLRRICEKRQTRFLDYRPETGSCVFRVEHFSKYTLDDSDDEGTEVEPRVDPKKARITPLAQNAKKIVGEKEKTADENMLRMKQQESSFILGPHMGQRGGSSELFLNKLFDSSKEQFFLIFLQTTQ
jgi:nuclear pore complex protein Nup98-Nup96